MCTCLFHIMTYFALGRYSAVGLLDQMVNLLLAFWGTSKLFFIVIVLIYISTNSIWVLLLSPFLPVFLIFCLFDNSHFYWGEMISHFFKFIFLWWLALLSLFSYSCGPSVCLENVYSWFFFLIFQSDFGIFLMLSSLYFLVINLLSDG